MASAQKSPYETLGVAKNATQDEIKKAYRGLAKKLHPDLNPGNKDAENRFKEINSAYERVGTAEARAAYERGEAQRAEENVRASRGPFYHQTQQDGGRYEGFDFDEDILSSIFGQARAHRRPARGADELYEMEIDLLEAALGAEREITLPSGRRLRVKIPAGVDTGARLRFAGQGGPGEDGAPAGDAYVRLRVRPSPVFSRAGADLSLELPITLAEAVLGAEIQVPTIDGSVLLRIPPGVSSGARLRITGKGAARSGGGGRGNQFVVLKIVLPGASAIDPDLKRAVEEWSHRHPYDPRAEMKRSA